MFNNLWGNDSKYESSAYVVRKREKKDWIMQYTVITVQGNLGRKKGKTGKTRVYY